MTIRALIAVILLLSCSIGSARSMYKCESSDGSMIFQDTPCESDQVTVGKEAMAEKLDKSMLTKKEKFYFDTYLLFMQADVSLNVCKNRNVPSASDLDFRLKRYKEIARYNIDNGERLVNAGTKKVSSGALMGFLNQRITSSTKKLRNMSTHDANIACRYLANSLAVAASQTPNRASGYAEGDLDPEGND